jgi:hypothetical protein
MLVAMIGSRCCPVRCDAAASATLCERADEVDRRVHTGVYGSLASMIFSFCSGDSFAPFGKATSNSMMRSPNAPVLLLGIPFPRTTLCCPGAMTPSAEVSISSCVPSIATSVNFTPTSAWVRVRVRLKIRSSPFLLKRG